ncbi:DUF1758 domain-containing protein [Trichonephila clavipes]|nr:DUF1758 domain-containing protein [Trichonephila clavipes]
MKIDEIDERIIFDTLDQEVGISSSTVNSDRHGNKNMLINAHLSNLLNLTPVRNPTDIVGLRNLYDRAETQIRSLESLGVKRRILLKRINTHPVETDTLGTRFGNSIVLKRTKDVKNEQEVVSVRLFLDNGSQRSFVLKSTSEKFNFPILRKENLSICTFGAKEAETKTLNIVKIKLKNRDDPNLCIEIEAVETEHISITNLPTPDRNIDKKI